MYIYYIFYIIYYISYIIYYILYIMYYVLYIIYNILYYIYIYMRVCVYTHIDILCVPPDSGCLPPFQTSLSW